MLTFKRSCRTWMYMYAVQQQTTSWTYESDPESSLPYQFLCKLVVFTVLALIYKYIYHFPIIYQRYYLLFLSCSVTKLTSRLSIGSQDDIEQRLSTALTNGWSSIIWSRHYFPHFHPVCSVISNTDIWCKILCYNYKKVIYTTYFEFKCVRGEILLLHKCHQRGAYCMWMLVIGSKMPNRKS